MSQSAVSHQVAELERVLGVALFTRRARRVELTAVGTQLFLPLREGFARISDGVAAVIRPADSRELDVQVYVTVAVRWLLPRLHRFQTSHPEVLIRLATSQRDWDFDDTADLGMVCIADPARPGLDATHLFDAELVAVCSPGTAQAQMGLRQPADLVNHSLLAVYTAPEEWGVWLEAAGVSELASRVVARVDSYLLAIEAATDGQGVALVPSFLVADDLRSGRLVRPLPLQVPQPRRWYLVCRRERRDEPAIVAFRNWLINEVADLH